MRTNILEIVCFILLIIIFSFYSGIKYSNYKLDKATIEAKYKIDSCILLINLYKTSDSLKHDFYNRSFHIHRDSVFIDKYGYFRSKYHKTYKIRSY